MPKIKKFVFKCLHAAYIQSLLQQDEGQQLFHIVQQAGRKRIRRMRKPRSTWVRKWLSEDNRQQLGHYSTFLIRRLCTKDVSAFQNYRILLKEVNDKLFIFSEKLVTILVLAFFVAGASSSTFFCLRFRFLHFGDRVSSRSTFLYW